MNIYLLEFVYYKYTLMQQPLHPPPQSSQIAPLMHAMLPEQIVKKKQQQTGFASMVIV